MNGLETVQIQCPWCWEIIDLVVDLSANRSLNDDFSDVEQEYVEDCSVCCRPITVKTAISHNGDLQIEVDREND